MSAVPLEPQADELVVGLFGDVHRPDCTAKPGMLWPWAGRNNLNGDKACETCLPDGLPEHKPYRFTPAEKERLLRTAGEAP